MEYEYDEAGNLTGKITPNLRADSKSIKYIYDYNRLARIDYPYRADTEYTYGAANASFNRVGRIVT
ncbi:MAG: hypothetical protein OEV42_21500, partial [Deltaproteobacteria bacterium]|nr:hypothetical protein [Deltaproteobacteria bacterium]